MGWLSIAHSQIPLCRLASCQPLADFVRELIFPSAWDWRIPHGLLLELDRHVRWFIANVAGVVADRFKLLKDGGFSHAKIEKSRMLAQAMGEKTGFARGCFDFG